jgi:hypothetical protein
MKPIFICVLAILIVACSQEEVENNLIFYQEYPRLRVWVCGEEVDLESLRDSYSNRRFIDPVFDAYTQKLWLWWRQSSNDSTELVFMDIVNKNEIKVDFKKDSSIQIVFIYNNIALCVYNSGLCKLINLIDITNVELDISKKKKTYGYGFIGFNCENIYFDDGYYNIDRGEYYEYKQILRYPKYSPFDNKIVGINRNDKIEIYDPIKSSSTPTKIRPSFNNSLVHDGDDLFFLKNNEIYFSKDAFNSKNFFVFLKRPAYRIWYKYKDGRRYEIYTPTGYIKILA